LFLSMVRLNACPTPFLSAAATARRLRSAGSKFSRKMAPTATSRAPTKIRVRAAIGSRGGDAALGWLAREFGPSETAARSLAAAEALEASGRTDREYRKGQRTKRIRVPARGRRRTDSMKAPSGDFDEEDPQGTRSTFLGPRVVTGCRRGLPLSDWAGRHAPPGNSPRRWTEVYPVGEESGARASSPLRHFDGSRKRLI
jgi:hypothetical protein